MFMGAPMKPHESPEEAALIRKAKDGDMDAFECLVRKYQRIIYALCRRLARSHQAADDLSQETFVKAYVGLSRFDDRRPFYPWLRKIVVNSWLNDLKSRKRESSLEDWTNGTRIRGFSSEPDQPEERAERTEFEERFSRALESLPEDQKSVFVLRYYESMSYREISEALELPNGTVMSRLNRARRRLKELLADSIMRKA